MTIDPWQKPARLSYCCYVHTSHATLTLHTMFSRCKNILQSKEETDNTPTDKTEQVTTGIKQGPDFQMLSFFKEILTRNTILWLFDVS